MSNVLYHLIVLCFVAFGILRGFNRKLSRQAPQCIGIAFAILCSNIFLEPVKDIVTDILPITSNPTYHEYIASNISAAVIYFVVFFIFRFATSILSFIFRRLETGMLDNIAGAFFGFFRYTIIISILYNLNLCVNTDSILLKNAKSDDGNAVHEVMLVAPHLLGSETVDDLAHKIQLEEAKKIS